MATRNVHAGLVVVGFPDSLPKLFDRITSLAVSYYDQRPASEKAPSLWDKLLQVKDDPKFPEAAKLDFIANPFWDYTSIKKIKGLLWQLSSTNDMTHGVIFIYMSRKSNNSIDFCIKELNNLINDISVNPANITKYRDIPIPYIERFSIKDLKSLFTWLSAEKRDIASHSGKMVAAVKIVDGTEVYESDEQRMRQTFVRLDPDFKKIQIFNNPIDIKELSKIQFSADLEDADIPKRTFGVFSGRPIALYDDAANKILERIALDNRLDGWLKTTKFGPNELDEYDIRPFNWQSKHRDILLAEVPELNEQQVRSFFLNYLVDDLNDHRDYTQRYFEVRTPSKKADDDTMFRADYFLTISNKLLPLEAKTNIGDGKAVLAQIHQYAHVNHFRQRALLAREEKWETKEVQIPTPHGVVLIGDCNGLWLAYVNVDNYEAHFVYSNDRQLFWPRQEFNDEKINEIKTIVSELIALDTKFGPARVSKIKTLRTVYEKNYESGNQYERWMRKRAQDEKGGLFGWFKKSE